MPNLYPVFDMPQMVEQQQTEPAPKYGKSWLFDFEKGDYVLDGAGRLVEADGQTAWAQWCVFAVLTQRFAHVIYSFDYGAEIDAALRQPSRKAVESELERVITEALLVDPRTQTVRDFSFAWEGDQVKVSFTAVPVIGQSKQVEVIVGG